MLLSFPKSWLLTKDNRPMDFTWSPHGCPASGNGDRAATWQSDATVSLLHLLCLGCEAVLLGKCDLAWCSAGLHQLEYQNVINIDSGSCFWTRNLLMHYRKLFVKDKYIYILMLPSPYTSQLFAVCALLFKMMFDTSELARVSGCIIQYILHH